VHGALVLMLVVRFFLCQQRGQERRRFSRAKNTD
jgi:hypothetical protein